MGLGVTAWVERDFRGDLRCVILAHGFARVRCHRTATGPIFSGPRR